MKKRDRIYLIVFVIMIMIPVIGLLFMERPSEAGSSSYQMIDIDDQSVRIERMKYNLSDTEISVPEKISEKKVIALGENALKPDFGVNREKASFSIKQNMAEKVILPLFLETIEGNPFADCPVLKSIDIDQENTHFTFTGGLLINKDTQTLIACPRSTEGSIIIPEDVLHIGKKAFYGCNIVEVKLPETLESIGGSAFAGCLELHQITIPPTVQTIGENAFDRCGNPRPGSLAVRRAGGEIDYPFTITAQAGSKAAEYAEETGYPLSLTE